ncbi:uncharacterized protein [Amphiura filiformis]|uniref:uncharacterized protein n=1 Tax=Amphiura filiformis TaxID=82378 RepID=UPI003B220383
MEETKLIEAKLNFSNNNHICLPPKKPPRKSSSEYVDSDDELTLQYGTQITGRCYSYSEENETFDIIKETADNVNPIECHSDGNTDSTIENVSIPKDRPKQDDRASLLQPSDNRSTSPADMKERKVALEKSIAWLRQELLDMRKTDQTLIMQLMNIQMKIHSLKTEVFADSPLLPRRPAFQTHISKPSEELFDYITDEDIIDEEETEPDVEEENGEPVAWREFQRRLSCRRTFSKRGKLPGIIKTTNTKS